MKLKSKTLKIPIALHVYSSLLLVSLMTIFVISFSSQVIMKLYIASECNRRINKAVISCKEFADAFRNSISETDSRTQEQIRDNMLNQITASTNISSDASTVLFMYDNHTGDCPILWPSNYLDSNLYDSADTLIQIMKNNNLGNYLNNSENNSTVIDGRTVYFRVVSIEYSSSSDNEIDELEHYYLLIFIDTNTYFSFSDAFKIILIRSFFFALIASTLISFICAFPIYNSTQKLALFANRIGKGDFTPLNSRIVSQELSDLKDIMNRMAIRLDESDKEQKTFFQNASHELRTPLMSIQGYAEGLKYDVFDNEKTEEAIDIIIDETTRLSNLVENLLSISKMDMAKNGDISIKKSMIDVLVFSDILLDKVRGSFLLNNKELINNISIKESYIYGNENDLFRMLENIFSNCIRYCENRVWFKIYADNNDVYFEITDDGPGISQDVLNHLFERFAKGSDGKHGIGLSLAKSIANEHNGDITATNIQGTDPITGQPLHGAKFVIRIPSGKKREQLSHLDK